MAELALISRECIRGLELCYLDLDEAQTHYCIQSARAKVTYILELLSQERLQDLLKNRDLTSQCLSERKS